MENFKKLVTKAFAKISQELKSEENIEYFNNEIIQPILNYTLTGKLKFLKYIHIYFLLILVLLFFLFILAILQIVLLFCFRKIS